MPNSELWGLGSSYQKQYRWLVIATLALIGLGGSVRVMNAGLACPDWPLCFGQFIPDYHPQVYFEFMHRVLAGAVSLAVVWLQWQLFRNPKVPRGLKAVAALSLVVLLLQVVMGGLTVLLQLHDKVVAMHLGLGTGFFALQVWIYLSVARASKERPTSRGLLGLCLNLLIAVYLQILLGGLVASNYAANVCPGEFPTCHGKMFPTFQGAIGLQVMHRTWAYFVLAMVIGAFFLIRKKTQDKHLWKLSSILLGVVLLQVLVGISNVLFYTPPLIAVIHLLFATKILWVVVRMIHHTSGAATA